MNEYMMIFRNEQSQVAEKPSPEQMKTMMQQWQQWIADIAAQGKYNGTNRLLSEGKTLKPNKVITDGPYLEAKEMVGGYLIVKAGNLDEAIEMARLCPNLIYGGNVEVRAVMPIEYDPKAGNFLQPK